MNPLQQAGTFLVQIVFDFFVMMLALRLILQFLRVNHFNPLVKTIIKITTPLVRPFQAILPTVKRMDLAVLTLLLLCETVKIMLIVGLRTTTLPTLPGTLIWASGDFLDHIVNIFFYAILIEAILSWIRPNQYNPMNEVLRTLTSPLMTPIQRIIPPVGGLDISPLPVMILLKLTGILFIEPIISMGIQLALS